MDSQTFYGNIELFLLGELDPELMKEMQAYLEFHPEVLEQVDAGRTLLAELQDHLSRPPVPPQLPQEIFQSLQKHGLPDSPADAISPAPSKNNTAAWLGRVRIMRIAAAAVILAGIAVILQLSGDRPEKQSHPIELAFREAERDLDPSLHELVAGASVIVRARLIEIFDDEGKDDSPILLNTRWAITEVLYGEPGAVARDSRPKVLGVEKTRNRDFDPPAPAETLDIKNKSKRERRAEEPSEFGEKGKDLDGSPEVIAVNVLRQENVREAVSKRFQEQELGAEDILFVKRIGNEFFLLSEPFLAHRSRPVDQYEESVIEAIHQIKADSSPTRRKEAQAGSPGKEKRPGPEEAEPANRALSGRWSGMAVDKPEDGTSRDSLILELTVSESGRLNGMASGEFLGGTEKKLLKSWGNGNRLGFLVEHRTGGFMEITLELIGKNLVGDGIPFESDGDRCDIFLSRMFPLKTDQEQ